VAAREGDPLADPALVRIAAPAGVLRRQHVVEPDPTEHRLFTAKVFYLTSARTASAAEHLALAFKRTHRAVLIGEPTSGANHFGGREPLGAGLSAFVPVGRSFDPDTGEDWEGRGITPDIAVPSDQALDVALRLATR
jgi:C-terminal processing protease CtpA/Prc